MTGSGVRDPGSGRAPPDTGPRIPDTVNEELERGDLAPRPPLRAPHPAAQPRLHHGCRPHAGDRHRRQYRHLQPVERRLLSPAAVRGPGRVGGDRATVRPEREHAGLHLAPELHRLDGGHDGLFRRGAGRRRSCQLERGRRAGARRGREDQPQHVRPARCAAGTGPLLPGRRSDRRQKRRGDPERHAVAASLRGGPTRRGPNPPHGRWSASCRPGSPFRSRRSSGFRS